MFYGLKQLDRQVSLTDGHGGISKNTIIIGGHLLSSEQCIRVPDEAVIYNSEHASSSWFNENYIPLLRRAIVWDYSADNARQLKEKLGRPVCRDLSDLLLTVRLTSRVAFCFSPIYPITRSTVSADMKLPCGAKSARSCLRSMLLDRRKPHERVRQSRIGSRQELQADGCGDC